ncbi:MAG: ABC transporter ATP-binding protein [Alistipes sp.]|nr:ABC transporter ATP-binding protein [Alistipes sp.]
MSQRHTILSIHNLGVKYEGVTALESVNLDIYADDFIGIVGPNGGGKSSLVKAIMGTISYSGEIRFDSTLRHKNHYKIGYMPQVSEFDTRFPISIEEVVLSGLQTEKGFWGRYTRADRQRATELLEQMGIAHLAKRPIGEVSGGQMQRALLCRAIIANPKLLILDEPTNFVDNKFEYEFYNMVQRLNERMAIIIVSHDLGTITSVVKSIVCVNHCVHRHDSNILTEEQLRNYNCPIQILSHGHIPHTVLAHHEGDCCHDHK